MQSDSIEGIYDTLKQTAVISKSAGGIGMHIHKIRATNSYAPRNDLCAIFQFSYFPLSR